MDLKANILLVAPSVKNSSCTHPRYTSSFIIYHIGLTETLEALIILMLTVGIIGANILVIFVINNRRYSPYIHQQPRYLLTSLALNDLAIGLLITPFGIVTALLHCWPYGEIFCQIQALLRGALSQQSAVILVCMAVDRYMCALHPRRYHKHSSKKGCVAILSITWIICLTVFGMLVLPKGYYFNNTGLLACEPFYSKPAYRILATCSLYFPTTMVLMYSYGSSFHVSRFRLSLPIPPPPAATASLTEKMAAEELQLSGSASRTMAAISLGFIVIVTPWTIQEVVTACTGSKLPPFLDFIVTWTALSNSFWNPFLYWLLNGNFRKLSRHLLANRCCPYTESTDQKIHCCNLNSDCDHHISLPLPPGPPSSKPPQCQHTQTRSDMEGLSEKYWGEILERTVSSNSLHALQRTFAQQHPPPSLPLQSQTSLNKASNLDLTILDDTSVVHHLGIFSNSEPKLCEHIYHDVNCARSKAMLYSGSNGGAASAGRYNSIKKLPDI